MASPPIRIIPRVAFASHSAANPLNRRRLAFSRINNVFISLDVPNDAPTDNNNNNRNGRYRVFVSVANYNDQVSSASEDLSVHNEIHNTRRIERNVNRSATSTSRTREGRGGARSFRRVEREQQEADEEEEEDEDSEDENSNIQRRSSRRRGKCAHNHALERSFCSKCHIRRRHLCRWWCRQHYRRQV